MATDRYQRGLDRMMELGALPTVRLDDDVEQAILKARARLSSDSAHA